MEMTPTYPAPVDQLLTLGEPEGDDWRDYRALGLADEHVPALLALMEDERLRWEAWSEGDEQGPHWAPLHAWRALGQLRAVAAAEPLVRTLLRDADEDDWAVEDIPRALVMIGPPALRAIRTALPAAAREEDSWGGINLSSSLSEIAREHPEVRPEVVETLLRQLRLWETQPEDLNGFLIHHLAELGAAEAAPVMQEAFSAGAVDESIMGDWEDVQVALGLLAERTTPRPRYNFVLRTPRIRRVRLTAPIPGSTSAAARSRQLRKAQKQAARKKRRR